jgi:hypothetical protein
MPSVYDRLYQWASETASGFGGFGLAASRRAEPAPAANELIYRLKHWPWLPPASRTADVFRALSVMSQRPVNRHWILTNSRLRPSQVDKLLERLVAEDAVNVVDSSKYMREGREPIAEPA